MWICELDSYGARAVRRVQGGQKELSNKVELVQEGHRVEVDLNLALLAGSLSPSICMHTLTLAPWNLLTWGPKVTSVRGRALDITEQCTHHDSQHNLRFSL